MAGVAIVEDPKLASRRSVRGASEKIAALAWNDGRLNPRKVPSDECVRLFSGLNRGDATAQLSPGTLQSIESPVRVGRRQFFFSRKQTGETVQIKNRFSRRSRAFDRKTGHTKTRKCRACWDGFVACDRYVKSRYVKSSTTDLLGADRSEADETPGSQSCLLDGKSKSLTRFNDVDTLQK